MIPICFIINDVYFDEDGVCQVYHWKLTNSPL